MYRVIRYFTDLQDNDHPYYVGNPFPRQGLAVTPERIAELASTDNKQHTPLIEAVYEPEAAAPAEETAEPAAEEKPKRSRRKKTEAE
jgi:hypothetical protein